MKYLKLTRFLLCAAAVLFVAGCGGAINATIGGTVTGLSGGTSVVLLNNGTDSITVTGSSFTFDQQIQAGSTYDVTISQNPLGETCTVTNGLGTVSQNSGNVTSILVSCNATDTSNEMIVGTVSGLATNNAVTLLTNGNDSVSVNGTASGTATFVFGALPVGVQYNVSVSSQPSSPVKNCVVASNGTGVIPAIGTPPLVSVTCS